MATVPGQGLTHGQAGFVVHTSNALTWLLLGGIPAALASGALSVTMDTPPRRRRPEQVPTEATG